jgi:hypothetical protein
MVKTSGRRKRSNSSDTEAGSIKRSCTSPETFFQPSTRRSKHANTVENLISKIKTGGTSQVSTKHILDGIASSSSSNSKAKAENVTHNYCSARVKVIRGFQRNLGR